MSVQATESHADANPGASITVLHVDDDPSFRDLTATFIEQEDDRVSVVTASSADEGLEKLSDGIDCIVSDYEMPGMDGIEFLETIRERSPALPFILFTGKGSEEIASEAISAGVTDYLQKETGTDQYAILCNRIKNAVDRYRSQQRLQHTKRRFQQIFEQSNDAILIVDPYNEEIRNANSRACDFLGYDREELLSMSPRDIHPHELDRFREFVDAVYDEGSGWTEELSCLRKDGETIDVHVSASTVTIDDRAQMLALIRDITAQRDHHEDVELFRTLLDHSTDGIYIIDPDTGELVDVNDTACQRLGYDREELRSMSVSDIDAVGVIDDWGDHVERVLTGDTIREGMVHQRKDGTTYPVEVRAKHIAVDEEERYLIATARDIAGEQRREEAIEGLHTVAQKILNAETAQEVADIAVEAGRETLAMPLNAVWFHDTREDVLEPVAWTDEAAEVVGEIPAFDSGNSLAWNAFETGECKHYEDVSSVSGCYNPGTPLRSEIILPLGDHGIMTFGSTNEATFTDTETSLAEILTRHLETALDRLERERSLRHERERFTKLFESLPAAVTHVRFEEETPVVQNVNPAFEETFGYDREQVIGKPRDDVVVPEDAHEEATAISDPIRTHGKVQEVIRRQTATGVGDFLFTGVSVGEIDDQQECFGIAFDISEQKAYERELEQQNARLDEFASLVSHDLRNPLRTAEGYLELAQTECDSSHLADASDAVARCQTIIDDLLTLARGGDTVGSTEPVSLSDVSEGSWQAIPSREATLAVETEHIIAADRSRLQQLLENLFTNAIEHGGEDVTVTVGSLADGFYIADDGKGIADGEKSDIFEAGYSTAADGVGFGLRIVKQIVTAHDWDIRVTDSADTGARFEITGVSILE